MNGIREKIWDGYFFLGYGNSKWFEDIKSSNEQQSGEKTSLDFFGVKPPHP